VHLESAVAYKRVRIDRQQMAVSLANPRDLQCGRVNEQSESESEPAN
jgi:hypothetical protein